jgi:hypothetical protein
MIKYSSIIKLSFLIALPLLLFSTSCKSRKKAVATLPAANENIAHEQLIDSAFKANFSEEWLSGKMGVEYKSAGSSLGFNANIRMRKDSVLWASITPGLGIEAVRVVLTVDSLKILNRLSNKYFLGDYKYLERMMGVSLEFKDIQSLLLGNYFEYQNRPFKKSYLERGQYVLENPGAEPYAMMKLQGQTYRLMQFMFEDKKVNRKLDIQYADHTAVGSGLVPFTSKTRVNAGQSIDLDMNWIKLEPSGALEFPFSIPSKYEPMY